MQKKKPVPAGRLLKEEGALQIYELSLDASKHYGASDFDLVTVAFNSSNMGIRVSRGSEGLDGDLKEPSQVVLTRHDFETLIASYRAYERAEKKRLALPTFDDFDPFLDETDLP